MSLADALQIAMLALFVIGASILCAALCNQAMIVVSRFLGWWARWPNLASVSLDKAIDMLAAFQDRCQDALAYRVRRPDGEGDSEATGRNEFSPWDLVGPVVYLPCFVVLVVGVFYFDALRLGGLLGLGSHVNVSEGGLQVIAGLLLTVTVTVWALVAFDVFGLSPLRRPFVAWPWLRWLAVGGFALSLLTGPLLFVWGQAVVEGGDASALAYVLVAIFGLLLLGALALSGWAILPAVLVAAVVVALLIRLAAYGSLVALAGIVWFLDGAAELVCELLKLGSVLGRSVWNWVVALIGERLKLHKIAEPDSRPPLLPDNAAEQLPRGRVRRLLTPDELERAHPNGEGHEEAPVARGDEEPEAA